MFVVATAGHVDHGKSTLVRALTGMEPDRWAEERRRGMTIDLGFAWTALSDGSSVAFVDVPGHERFVGNMLAGAGPAPAVLFVVAADQGWQAQSSEHLAVLDGLGIEHGLLVVTRSDLAEPTAARQDALSRIAATSLGEVASVAVSAVTGEGLDELDRALRRLTGSLPTPHTGGRVRLWVDRSFSIKGSGTVVTGTLGAGSIGIDDRLCVAPTDRPVRVRGLQVLGTSTDRAEAVARVAVNLRGADRGDVRRGDALVTPDAWLLAREIDVRLGHAPARLPAELRFHVGSAAVGARVRRFSEREARLLLTAPLPLSVGDRGLLRDPSRHDVVIGVTVLDPAPVALSRRGAAARRATELAAAPDRPDAASELARRRVVTGSLLKRLGVVPPASAHVVDDWYADPSAWTDMGRTLVELVRRHHHEQPLAEGVPLEEARATLALPTTELVVALAKPPLEVSGSVVRSAAEREALPAAVRHALDALRADLAREPFASPSADRLQELGLGTRELAAAERANQIIRLTERVVLLPDAPAHALAALERLPDDFTVSQAGAALRTSRRVTVPLLERLDRQGVTALAADGTRRLRSHPA